MIDSPYLESAEPIPGGSCDLPFAGMVRTVCEAALAGPEILYEAMLKVSLAIEAFAPTYGLSIWTVALNDAPRVKWAEGLNAEEMEEASKVVAATFSIASARAEVRPGETAICLPLATPSHVQE